MDAFRFELLQVRRHARWLVSGGKAVVKIECRRVTEQAKSMLFWRVNPAAKRNQLAMREDGGFLADVGVQRHCRALAMWPRFRPCGAERHPVACATAIVDMRERQGFPPGKSASWANSTRFRWRRARSISQFRVAAIGGRQVRLAVSLHQSRRAAHQARAGDVRPYAWSRLRPDFSGAGRRFGVPDAASIKLQEIFSGMVFWLSQFAINCDYSG